MWAAGIFGAAPGAGAGAAMDEADEAKATARKRAQKLQVCPLSHPRKGRSDGRHAFVARSAASQKRNVIARRKSPEISMYLDQALPAHSRLGLAAESSATTLGAPAGEAHNLAPSARNDQEFLAEPRALESAMPGPSATVRCFV